MLPKGATVNIKDQSPIVVVAVPHMNKMNPFFSDMSQ